MSRNNKNMVKHKTDKKIEPLFNRWNDTPYSAILKELKTMKRISKKTPKYEEKFDFRFANLRKTRLSDANIHNACLDSVYAHYLYLSDSTIDNCLICNGDFKNVNISNGRLENSEFRYCDFEDSELIDVSLKNSIIDNCKFNRSEFRNIDVDKAILDNSDFSDLKYPENANIIGTPKSIKNASIDRHTFLMLEGSEFKNLIGNEGKIIDMNTNDYDVALSFAGEQRSYVEEVAEYLRGNHIRVFYDNFETADLWGKDLVTHLTELYSEKSMFVIVFASEDYVSKAWTNVERRALLTKFLNGNYDKVLPVKMDDAKIPGFTDIKGYLDSRKFTPEEIGELFIKKLRQNS